MKILFFSRDPGAANAIIPVFIELKEKPNFNIDLFGKDYSLKKYDDFGLEYGDISKFLDIKDEDSVNKFIKKYGLIVTGTTSDQDYTDRVLWKVAKELKIPTLVIVDQWLNYKPRFMINFSDKVIGGQLIEPDFICVPDELVKKEMIKEGLSSQRIHVTGQPYFETIRKNISSVTEKKKDSLREGLGIKFDDFVITFASEPIIESSRDPFFLGYTQITILDDVVPIVKTLSNKLKRRIFLIIKLHPRNNPDLFQKYIDTDKVDRLNVVINQSAAPHLLISISDLIVGMSSMFLLESVIAQKPILSIQTGLTKEDPFVLSRLGITKTVTRKEEILPSVENLITSGASSDLMFKLIQNPTQNIIKLIESLENR